MHHGRVGRHVGMKPSSAGRFLQFIEKITILALFGKNFARFRATSKNRIAKSIHPPLDQI